MRITLSGRPITKKNSSRIVQARGRIMVIPSKQYVEYLNACRWQINVLKLGEMKISSPINLQCVYYMPTRHRVDLVNLLEATCDILVECGVLADDNSKIVASHDGSCVLYDKNRPRVEITITPADIREEQL
jgi:Holliday junction resolvase RusA-like endonuclease